MRDWQFGRKQSNLDVREPRSRYGPRVTSYGSRGRSAVTGIVAPPDRDFGRLAGKSDNGPGITRRAGHFVHRGPLDGCPRPSRGPALPAQVRAFLEGHCVGCHDGENRKGGLDLDAMAFQPGNPRNFSAWVKVFDRASAGEMPPRKNPRPDPKESATFARSLADSLKAEERERVAREGRATRRRLNRHEYENVLRDLLSAPWLEVKDMLPEDGVAHRFNKVGGALDVSHVQMARYLAAADHALRQVMATQVDRPPTRTVRYYAREQPKLHRQVQIRAVQRVARTGRSRSWARRHNPASARERNP